MHIHAVPDDSTPEYRPPRAPRTLGGRGKSLWKSIVTDYELPAHDLETLERACQLADLADALKAEVDAGSIMVNTPAHGMVVNRALTEFRATTAQVQKLLASLDLPGEEDDQPRPETDATIRARNAAYKRWHPEPKESY